jgi:hypothetical protein
MDAIRGRIAARSLSRISCDPFAEPFHCRWQIRRGLEVRFDVDIWESNARELRDDAASNSRRFSPPACESVVDRAMIA